MAKMQIFQTAAVFVVVNKFLFWTFGNFIFEFVSDFDIRISSFGFPVNPAREVKNERSAHFTIVLPVTANP
jgi:hypothetical protein